MKTPQSAHWHHLTALLGTSLLAACGSSSSGGGGTQAPPAEELPEEYSVFIADFGFTGVSRPYLFDLETGERRPLVASLPANVDLQGQFSQLSPDGRILVVNLEDDGNGGSSGDLLRIIDLETGTTRTPSFPSGFALRQPANGEPQEGGEIGGSFDFSADSSLAVIRRGFGDLFLSDGEGRNITPLEVDGDQAFSHGWIGSSNRLALVTEDDATFSTRVTVLDVETGAFTHYDPAPGETAYVDELRASGNRQFVVIAMEASGTPGDETEDVVAINLSNGNTSRWTVPGLDDSSIRISDDGSHVAFVAYDVATQEPIVSIGETNTGVLETVSTAAMTPAETFVDNLAFEPGADRIAFSSNHRDEEIEEITVGAFGGLTVVIDPTLPLNSDIEDFAWSPNGRFLAYALDGPNVDQIFVYDAESTALPIAVSDSAVASGSTEFAWSPNGAHLLVLERLAGTFVNVTSSYSGTDWSQRRELGEGWRQGQDSQVPEAFRSVRFSSDGTRVIWRAPRTGGGSGFLDGLDLWSTVLSDPVGTKATLHTGGSSAPVIENFWLRKATGGQPSK